MKILLISGKAGCGKDTVGNMFAECISENGKRVLVTHYADLLKYILTKFFNWDGKKDEKGREKLQRVGTDVIRKQIPDFWVGFIMQILDLFPDEWDVVIIPDLRFPNEINRFKEAGYDVSHIEVVRPEFTSKLNEAQKAHSSETAMDGIAPDFTFINGSSLSELKTTIAMLCNAFKEK